MAFNHEEVNFLVWRYLEEAGYRHTAFVFAYESNVSNYGIDGTSVPRGALLNLFQKGMLFSEAEVFSLLPEGEVGVNFEKAIGSMSACTPHAGPSTSSTSPTNTSNTNMEYTNSNLNSDSTNLKNESNMNNNNNHASSTNQKTQLQRDRENRAQQSTPLQHNNSTSTPTATLSRNAPPPRGAYRTPTVENKTNSTPTSTLNSIPSTSSTGIPNLNSNPSYPTSLTSASTGSGNHSLQQQQQFYSQQLNQHHANFVGHQPPDSEGFLPPAPPATSLTNGIGNKAEKDYLVTTLAQQQRFHGGGGANGTATFTAGHVGKKAAAAHANANASVQLQQQNLTQPNTGLNGTRNASTSNNLKDNPVAYSPLSLPIIRNNLTVYANHRLLPRNANFDPEIEVDRTDVVYLKGHVSEVFICSWNPKNDYIVSGYA